VAGLPAELTEDRAVAVLRAASLQHTRDIVTALVSSGIRCVELTWTIEGALGYLAEAAAVPGAVVGMGTVLHPEQARAAIEAGASFLVTPGLRPQVAATATEHGIPFLMGAWTPTEVAAAGDLSPAAVKLFPAEIGGPAHLRALRGPFGELEFIPSGGVSPATAGDWLAAGAVALSAGGSVAPAQALLAGDAAIIEKRARQLRKAIDAAVAR
jgi:2-dehydro-3-deoxyphosphogluconate aldolase / (4S)-4-hydroxy-2-oxoglutarate aldolase